MSKNFKGFKDFEKKLEKATDKASGEVAFEKLFNENFMTRYTSVRSIDELFKKLGIEVESEEEFEALPEEKLDEAVRKNSQFSSWQDMLGKAGEEYMGKKIKRYLK